jgi:molecular chaperone DnaK
MAFMSKSEPKIIQNRECEDYTPSVVGMYKGETIVGRVAVDRMLLIPRDTIYSIKRLIGRAYSDLEVRRLNDSLYYQVTAPLNGTADSVCVILGGKEYSPVEITSKILRKLKKDAEIRFGEIVDSAVITVPAYYNEIQKDAIRKSCLAAGLNPHRLLSEPAAAVIGSGIDITSLEDSKNILVYSLGATSKLQFCDCVVVSLRNWV